MKAALAATAEVASIWTTDTSDNPKIMFNKGETVRIRWTASGTVDIAVKFEDGSTAGSWSDQNSQGSIDYNPTKEGLYMIYCTGAKTITVAYGTFMVFAVPELPIGTIGAVLMPLTALMIYKKRRP